MRDEETSCARPAIAENGPTNRWACWMLQRRLPGPPDLCTGVMKVMHFDDANKKKAVVGIDQNIQILNVQNHQVKKNYQPRCREYTK
ncbi:hypothetical protein T03_13046 [Trichinella britovi]|uniref:Uncharacterized protein n=1 Tax=Trichinella britovi TaxID=45882 RepID=A0A0V1CB55_TRIBR|nr:hypothetical protein T03_13046 [Trichinella britovi]